jgi:cAMP phosphodiesterase
MKLRVLGCSGRLDRRHFSPGYLLDDELLLDGGTVNSALDPADAPGIRWAAVTHAHLDHVKELPFLVQSRVEATAGSLTIVAIAPVIAALRAHIFNGVIWSDLTKVGQPPALVFQELTEGALNAVGRYWITPIRLRHTIPCTGLLVASDDGALAYTGDAAAGDDFWRAIAENKDVRAVIIDTAYPDRLRARAEATGHYCPEAAAADIAKIGRPIRVLVTHMHPTIAAEILADYAKVGLAVEALEQGQSVEL